MVILFIASVAKVCSYIGFLSLCVEPFSPLHFEIHAGGKSRKYVKSYIYKLTYSTRPWKSIFVRNTKKNILFYKQKYQTLKGIPVGGSMIPSENEALTTTFFSQIGSKRKLPEKRTKMPFDEKENESPQLPYRHTILTRTMNLVRTFHPLFQ